MAEPALSIAERPRREFTALKRRGIPHATKLRKKNERSGVRAPRWCETGIRGRTTTNTCYKGKVRAQVELETVTVWLLLILQRSLGKYVGRLGQYPSSHVEGRLCARTFR